MWCEDKTVATSVQKGENKNSKEVGGGIIGCVKCYKRKTILVKAEKSEPLDDCHYVLDRSTGHVSGVDCTRGSQKIRFPILLPPNNLT
jgi:hypothetical protein